jgi:hypothetical protein
MDSEKLKQLLDKAEELEAKKQYIQSSFERSPAFLILWDDLQTCLDNQLALNEDMAELKDYLTVIKILLTEIKATEPKNNGNGVREELVQGIPVAWLNESDKYILKYGDIPEKRVEELKQEHSPLVFEESNESQLAKDIGEQPPPTEEDLHKIRSERIKAGLARKAAEKNGSTEKAE